MHNCVLSYKVCGRTLLIELLTVAPLQTAKYQPLKLYVTLNSTIAFTEPRPRSNPYSGSHEISGIPTPF